MFLELLEAVPPGRVLRQPLRDSSAPAAVLLDVKADTTADRRHRQRQRVVHVAEDPAGTLASQEVQGVHSQLVRGQASRGIALAAASNQPLCHSTLKHLPGQPTRLR